MRIKLRNMRNMLFFRILGLLNMLFSFCHVANRLTAVFFMWYTSGTGKNNLFPLEFGNPLIFLLSCSVSIAV